MVIKGIDNIKSYDSYLGNKKIGLITSISGVDNNLISTIDILHKNYTLTALFAPEHGVRGDKEAGECIDTYIDPATGIPVYSLYRKESKHFTKEMLQNVDAIVFDIQDLGVRYYTFISTMINAMKDCASYGKEMIVLDRPNPLGGEVLEGNVLNPQYTSFVGAYPLPTRYGLTIGELAMLVNEEEKLGCNLVVIPCKGLKRRNLYPEMNQIWVMPSPAMPRFETALLYPGTCLFEGTNVSEGRGTSCPFEIIGAPFIDANQLVRQMRGQKLLGVEFTPAYFKPTSSKYSGVFCQGIHIHITDYERYESYKTGLVLLEQIKNLYPKEFAFLTPEKEGNPSFISLLAGSDVFEHKEWTSRDILEQNQLGLEAFLLKKKKYHLYD